MISHQCFSETFSSLFCFGCRIPGRLNDRRTPLGELNWIFTAITDTIAWNTLPRGSGLFDDLSIHTLLIVICITAVCVQICFISSSVKTYLLLAFSGIFSWLIESCEHTTVHQNRHPHCQQLTNTHSGIFGVCRLD